MKVRELINTIKKETDKIRISILEITTDEDITKDDIKNIEDYDFLTINIINYLETMQIHIKYLHLLKECYLKDLDNTDCVLDYTVSETFLKENYIKDYDFDGNPISKVDGINIYLLVR